MPPDVIWADILLMLPAPSSQIFIPDPQKSARSRGAAGGWKDGPAIQSLARKNAVGS